MQVQDIVGPDGELYWAVWDDVRLWGTSDLAEVPAIGDPD
jgi:hypothetical protein